MKIAHVGLKGYPPNHGGVEMIVYNLTKSIPEYEYFYLVEFDLPESKIVKVLPNNIFRQFIYILKFIKDNKVEIVHFHKETFIPHAILCYLFTNKKIVLTIHGCAWRIKRWNLLFRFLFFIADILACLILKHVIFVDKPDYDLFSKIIPWRTLNYIPNGVETQKIICDPDIKRCVYIGRISPEKNILLMVENFKKIKKILHIYGPFDKHDVRYKNKVLNKINETENVEYKGVLKYNEIIPTLSKYNTLINLSQSEGMPIAVLEAAAIGMNLVLSNIEQHRVLGFPDVRYVDINQLEDWEDFSGVSLRNKLFLENNYSIESTASKYKELYMELS